MFQMLAKSARSILPWVGKNVKQAVKSVAKHSKSNVINTGKEALRQEIARYQKGGGLINTKARNTGRVKRR